MMISGGPSAARWHVLAFERLVAWLCAGEAGAAPVCYWSSWRFWSPAMVKVDTEGGQALRAAVPIRPFSNDGTLLPVSPIAIDR